MNPDPDRSSPSSVPPLIRAIHSGSEEIVRLLLTYGANPSVVHEGCSASEYAAMGSSASMKSLIEKSLIDAEVGNQTLPAIYH